MSVVERQHKVVLIGAEGYEITVDDRRIECFRWKKINKIKNLRDYALVILNLLSLDTESARAEVDWNVFDKLLDFDNAMDILENQGRIVVVGDPRFRFKLDGPPKISRDFLAWTGAEFGWDSQPGDTISILPSGCDPQFSEYISKMKSWDYSLAFSKLNEIKFAPRYNLPFFKERGNKLTLELDGFCSNRYKNILAGQFHYQFVVNYQLAKYTGSVVFLPKINLSEEETIQLVLTTVCGIATNLSEPKWVSELIAPGQDEIDAEITSIQDEIECIFKKLEQAKQRRLECREVLKLIYEREFALEPVVRNILREFGAEVEEPTENNKEDGWLRVNVGEIEFEGVLEIKSTKSETFNDMGRKQLLDWIDRGRTLRGKNYKGIFIGNNAVDIPVGERKNPFEANWSKAASLSEICVLKTEDIYCMYLLKSKGLIDMNQLWSEIFKTKGVFEMDKYYELLEKT